MKKPLISVIVPVYNTAPWLRRCLDSICSQSYHNLEILCINDGSTDNSAEILEEYAAKDARIKLFTQANAGLSAARNTGLEHASGEWITGVDSDDYLYPGIYEQAIKHCQDDVDIVFFGVQQVDEEYNLLPPNQYFSLPKEGKYKLTPELAAQLNVCFVSKLWRRSLIEENALRFPVGLVHEDEAMYYIAAPYIRNIAICPAIGYAYLQRHGSIMNESGLTSLNRAKRLVRILKYVHSFYKTTNNTKPNFKSYLATMFIRNCSNLFWAKPLEERDEIKKLIAPVIQECDILHLDFRIDRFISHERKGLLTITRCTNISLYRIFRIPIWVKWYTNHGKKVTLRVLLYHLKNNSTLMLKFFISKCFRRLRYTALLIFDKIILRLCTKKLKIHDTETTLLYILKNKCSVSRYGDGELNQCLSTYNIGFQRYNKTLAQKLKDILYNHNNARNHILCIPYAYNNTKHLTKGAAEFWLRISIQHKLRLLKKLPRIQYFDSLCTRIYMDYHDKSKANIYFSMWKQIWDNLDVCIIEGTKTRLGVGNDLFNNVKTLRRILVPEINAFDKYNEIMDSAIRNCTNNDLILLAIGPTATVLSFDLAKLGYWAIDIGHLDVEYEWLKMKTTTKVNIDHKYVNEVPHHDVRGVHDEEYESSIIDIITKEHK